MAGLSESSESLDRYIRPGEGYDLSRHSVNVVPLLAALREALTEAALK
jgi:hypothetical protein